ncbi:hypothetical protein [Parabacteroides faecis]|uniref:hypothetical protein n=1 Tax=Parabacteroides faecis TaxID=1217282 RepID=UPI003522C767
MKGLSWRVLSVAAGESVRSIRCLSEASFGGDSERRMRSSKAGAALIFWLLFYQEKSNIQIG